MLIFIVVDIWNCYNMSMKKATNWNLEKSKEGFRMTKRKIWIILFIIGIVMILGASEFSRFLANEINWYTAGIILSIVSGLGLLFEMYFRRNK